MGAPVHLPAGRRPAWAAAALLVVSIAVAAGGASPGNASSSGAWSKEPLGCYCHTGGVSADVSASLAGVPDEFDPGASYPLTVRIIEAPGAFDGVEPRGGFDLQASAGALITRGWDDLQVSQDGGEATHTLMGSHQLSWEVTWQAPQERDARVRFFLLVNRVDGSLAPDGGDHWARAGYTSTPAGFAAPAPPAGASTPDVTWAAAAAGALGAAAGFAAGRAVRRWPPRA